MKNVSIEQKKEFLNDFPFAYVGGGYFRRKGVSKGEVAEIVHGDQIVEKVMEYCFDNLKLFLNNEK